MKKTYDADIALALYLEKILSDTCAASCNIEMKVVRPGKSLVSPTYTPTLNFSFLFLVAFSSCVSIFHCFAVTRFSCHCQQ